MAIRTISYSVKSDGISPNTEQQAGLQSEHAVTQLVFTLDSTLYQALLSEKGETDTLVYRFDCCDSMGGAVKTEPKTLTGNTVTFAVGENLTRSGGKARVYLVISRYNAAKKTETELLSFPAKLRFENVPETDSDNGNSRESLSTLTEAAKNAAARAEQSADTAVEAQGKTEAARLAIEGDSTVIFDGNGTYGEMDVDLVVDTELSDFSGNAIANKAVTKKLSRNLSDRYILFIGDSYADNWAVNSNVGLIEAVFRQIASTLGIGLETNEWKKFRSTHYAKISKGGIGFSAGAQDVKDGPYLNAFDRVNNFIINNQAFMNKVTDVVFALGYNDAAKAVYSDNSTYNDIKDKINLCNTLINNNSSHYVNKYLFAVGWGSNPGVRWQANHIYKNVYSYSAELGWIYSDIHYIMYDSDLYYTDWVHPNMNGSKKIAGRILNTLLGNSSVITCEPKYYNTTTSKGDTVAVGYLNVVNNELAQFFLTGNVIYDGSLITVPKFEMQEICEITGLVPFGETSPALLANCSFHIADTVNNTGSNVMLSCCVIKKLEGPVEGHNKYKSYLYIKNTTDSEIKFNMLAPNNGVIDIIPYL